MTRNLTAAIAAAMLAGFTSGTAVLAEESPSAQPPHRQGMMSEHAGMMNMMGQMGPEHMTQMTRMIDNCNRMMERADRAPTGQDAQPAPDTQG